MDEEAELIKKFENREPAEPTSRPNLLDVVKIDGRWAQVVGEGGMLFYLGNSITESINWDDFQLTKDWKGLSVSFVKKSTDFTDEELSRIHWEPEQKQHQYL